MAKILLTGLPGCGKTTLIRRLIAQLPDPKGGFYTQEIRQHGVRKGFELITLDNQRGVLANVDIRSPYRISKYGVDIEALENIGVEAIKRALAVQGIVVIDEIGPMEILSPKFCQAVIQALKSETTVIATIVKRNIPFADRVKVMPEVTLLEVTPRNREEVFRRLLEKLMSE